MDAQRCRMSHEAEDSDRSPIDGIVYTDCIAAENIQEYGTTRNLAVGHLKLPSGRLGSGMLPHLGLNDVTDRRDAKVVADPGQHACLNRAEFGGNAIERLDQRPPAR